MRSKGKTMAKTNGINTNKIFEYPNIYTKRTCLDNSEIYITSKLNMLYEKTLSDRNMYNSKRMLKKIIQSNHLDETN